MQFLVFSDSHGDTNRMALVLRRNPDIKSVIFLGDGMGDLEVLARLYPTHSFRAVRGNCDGLMLDYPIEDVFTLYGKTVFLCHGHTLGVKGGVGAAVERAKEVGADVLLFGHTHRPIEEYRSEQELYICNPGSISRPVAGDPSFAILDILPNGGICISHGKIPLFSHGNLD